MDNKDKVVFITGSSSGIGRATAQYFLARGWLVAATMRDIKNADNLKNHPDFLVLPLDVTRPDMVAGAVEKTLRRFGRIDVLVNNAGYGLLGPFEAATDNQIQRQIDTNLTGVIRVTRAVIPTMRRQKSGVIVNLSSTAGKIGFPFYSYYNATKFAVEGLSEALYTELSGFGIRVKLIEPGPIDTDFFTRSAVYIRSKSDPDLNARADKSFGTMRHGNRTFLSPPSDVARLIYQAATDSSGRLRYPAGKVAAYMLWIRRLLPESLFLRSMLHAFRATP